MAKKKAAAKKSSTKAQPAKKAAPVKKSSAKSAKPTKASSEAAKKTTATRVKANGAASNGNGAGKAASKKSVEQKSNAVKKAATSGSGNPLAYKAKNNGSADEKGLNPQTYQMLRQDIISTLWKYDEITFDEPCAAMEKIHGRNFVNDSQKYLHQVMTDLMNIDLVEKVEQSPNRQAFRIRQRLGD